MSLVVDKCVNKPYPYPKRHSLHWTRTKINLLKIFPKQAN